MDNKAFEIFHDRCTGCGVCAGACATNAINMRINEYGEYQPDCDSTACTQCGHCRKLCPMVTVTASGPGAPFGRFEKFFVAHTTNAQVRQNSASGGVVTQLLIDLMAAGRIDRATGVAFTAGTTAPFFAPAVCSTPEEIRLCGGSKYYPLEFSGILKSIRGRSERWAVVCLPCVATALSRLRELDPNFRNIRYLIALTCGHNKTMKYLETLLHYYGLVPPFKALSFRKKGEYPVARYALYVEDAQGKIIEENFDNGVINTLWCHYYFSQRACLTCRDTFGMNADISAMDAWLDPFAQSRQGYNFLAMTTDFAGEEFSRRHNIWRTEISSEDVLASQKVIVQRKSDGQIPLEYLANHFKAEAHLLSGGDAKAFVENIRIKRTISLKERLKSFLSLS